MEQALAEREALDRLAEALSQVSASQGAADAIERGDFAGAREQLSALGEEADQLSDAAKRRLSQALQSAANATTEDRQLADRERQAATALSRSNYAEQRQALRQLGEQLERSGARGMPQSQLARDSGRLQQQQQQTAIEWRCAIAVCREPSESGRRAGWRRTIAARRRAAGRRPGCKRRTARRPASRAALAREQAPRSPQAARMTCSVRWASEWRYRPSSALGLASNRPTAPKTRWAPIPGVGVRSVAEATYAQQTGQVAPEQNLVPGEQRPVVRGYFR